MIKPSFKKSVMANQESRPVFPTNQQWESHKEEQKQKLDKKLSELNSIGIKEDQELVANFNNMMGECYDKSKFRRFFSDNNGCTEARGKFMEAILDSAKFREANQLVQKEKDKYT